MSKIPGASLHKGTPATRRPVAFYAAPSENLIAYAGTGRNDFVREMDIPANQDGLIREIRKGFGYEFYDRLSRQSGLEKKLIADSIGIPKATLARRAKSGMFTTDESDKLYRVARIVGAAIELFEGDKTAAADWMVRPGPALDGRTPAQMAGTSVETDAALALIGRLEHGIPS
jgi:putative toxin-antitoxin system antitoxin component (TIGR02293 family)